MLKKPSITSTQLALTTAGSALMFPYTFLPILKSGPANQDVWIVLLLTIVFIIILNAPLLFLVNKFRNFDLGEINESIMSKPVGKAATFVFAIFACFCFIACMQIAVLYTKLFLLADTPEWVIAMFAVVPVAYASHKGAGTITRLASFVIPMLVLTIFIFFILGIKDMEFSIIMPILKDSTYAQIISGAFITASRYSEVLIVAVYSIYLKKNHSVNTSYFKGLSIFGVSFFILLVSTLLLLGPKYAKLLLNPFLVYTRQVGGRDFLQRVQMFNFMAWFSGALIKLTVYNQIACFLFSKVFNKSSHRPFVLPLSIIGYLLCLLPILQKTSTFDLLNRDSIFPFIVLSVVFIIPLVMVIVYLFRYKEVNKIIDDRNTAVAEAANKDAPPTG